MKKLLSVLTALLLIVSLSTSLLLAESYGYGTITYNAWAWPFRDNCKTKLSVNLDLDDSYMFSYYLRADVRDENGIVLDKQETDGYITVVGCGNAEKVAKAYGDHGWGYFRAKQTSDGYVIVAGSRTAR
ncbi:MAG: hypothetical protein GXY43_08485 [Clostridiaceae bacterium]|nr:hypothetical protein [Clostridiaceae bacterium]